MQKKMVFLLVILLLPQLALAQVSISPGSDSNPVLTTNGKKVWPPVGPGCEQLVKCCEAGQKVESTSSLMCQMTVATSPVDCVQGLKTYKTYLSERKISAPVECGNH